MTTRELAAWSLVWFAGFGVGFYARVVTGILLGR